MTTLNRRQLCDKRDYILKQVEDSSLTDDERIADLCALTRLLLENNKEYSRTLFELWTKSDYRYADNSVYGIQDVLNLVHSEV